MFYFDSPPTLMSIVGDHIAIITLFHSASSFGTLLLMMMTTMMVVLTCITVYSASTFGMLLMMMTMVMVVFTCITLPVHLVHSGCC